MRLRELIKFDRLQMRRNETTTKSIQNDPIVNRLGMAQKHSTIEHVHFIAVGWFKTEIFLRQGKDLWVELNHLERRSRQSLFEELVKPSAAEADHEHAFRVRMKDRAGGDRARVRND